MLPIAPTSLDRAPDRTVHLITTATRQGGVVARWQLARLGFASGTIARWITAGRLIRVHPGVYAVGHRAVSVHGQLIAALLYAGRGSALSDNTATWLWQVGDVVWYPIHVVAPSARRSLEGVRIHRPRRISRVFHRGFPVTPLVDSLRAFAAVSDDRQVRKALAEADFRHQLDPLQVLEGLGRGRRGSTRLRRAVERHLPELALTASPAEDDLLFLCEREGIPIPEPNARIGPYRVDALWREARVVVELDGRDGHSSLERRTTDHERDMYLRSRDHIVLRYARRQLRRRSKSVAEELLRLIAARTLSEPSR